MLKGTSVHPREPWLASQKELRPILERDRRALERPCSGNDDDRSHQGIVAVVGLEDVAVHIRRPRD
jgi:hypothetical protein